jgi:hypothetical protein
MEFCLSNNQKSPVHMVGLFFFGTHIAVYLCCFELIYCLLITIFMFGTIQYCLPRITEL